MAKSRPLLRQRHVGPNWTAIRRRFLHGWESFQVISERNGRASLIVTTSLPFGEQTKVFADPRLAKGVVDSAHPPRLHHRDRQRILTRSA
ncbi:MAG: ATP-binding protein [Gaiellaceae bacterium]